MAQFNKNTAYIKLNPIDFVNSLYETGIDYEYRLTELTRGDGRKIFFIYYNNDLVALFKEKYQENTGKHLNILRL